MFQTAVHERFSLILGHFLHHWHDSMVHLLSFSRFVIENGFEAHGSIGRRSPLSQSTFLRIQISPKLECFRILLRCYCCISLLGDASTRRHGSVLPIICLCHFLTVCVVVSHFGVDLDWIDSSSCVFACLCCVSLQFWRPSNLLFSECFPRKN